MHFNIGQMVCLISKLIPPKSVQLACLKIIHLMEATLLHPPILLDKRLILQEGRKFKRVLLNILIELSKNGGTKYCNIILIILLKIKLRRIYFIYIVLV